MHIERILLPLPLLALVLAACSGGSTSADTEEDDATADSGDVLPDGDASEPAACTSDGDCDDGIHCNGAETCGDAGTCVAGTAPDCDDEDPCTTDACEEESSSCSHVPLDADGDGYPAATAPGGETCSGTDCDDDDEAIHPDAPAGCGEGDDHDCDGIPDRDEDGDGWVTDECADGDDCDDGDPEVFPGSTVLGCDEVDHDCNGHPDHDNDGDGQDRVACLGTDCDDEDFDVRVGVVEEPCDGVDTNCDGVLHVVEDADEDGVANETCGGDDCDDTEPTVLPGAPELCDDVDQDCDGSLLDAPGADDDGDTVLDEGCGGDDCDDEDAATHPGATEVCGDGIDQDCDGAHLPAPAGGPLRVTNDDATSEDVSAAWSGSEYGAAWRDERDGNSEIYFARISDAGAKIGSDVRVTADPGSSSSPSLVWAGSRWSLAWSDNRSGNPEVWIAHLSGTGSKLGSDSRLSAAGDTSNLPSLVWTGSRLGVSFDDHRSGTFIQVYFHLVETGTSVPTDVHVSDGTNHSRDSSLVWTGSEFGVAWEDTRADSNYEIYFARISASGSKVGSEVRVTDAAGSSTDAHLAWTGSTYAVTWEDLRDGASEVYLAILDPTGARLGSDVRITSIVNASDEPTVAWNGDQIGLLWRDRRDGDYEMYFTLVSTDGSKLVTDVRLTTSGEYKSDSTLVWGDGTFHALWMDDVYGNREISSLFVDHCP